MSKFKRIISNVVYWSTLVGPIYSLIVGTVKGFIGAIQSIKADEKLKAERDAYLHPDEIEIDLSQSPEALNFSQVVNFINEKEKNNG